MSEPIFSNDFGSITREKVTLNYKSGLTSIPIKKITSISVERKRNLFFAFFGFATSIAMVALILFDSIPLNGLIVTVIIIVGLLGLLVGLAHWIGPHEISFAGASENIKPLKIEMSRTKEGQDFYRALEKQIFKT
ncbi:hypothetical protein JYT72_02450 [Crocinitomix catalasitica]|nr:hypothetical protein [Crocinitomix catalasitica]